MKQREERDGRSDASASQKKKREKLKQAGRKKRKRGVKERAGKREETSCIKTREAL